MVEGNHWDQWFSDGFWVLKTTIDNDGLRWLCTIGPTMEWLCTIVEVYAFVRSSCVHKDFTGKLVFSFRYKNTLKNNIERKGWWNNHLSFKSMHFYNSLENVALASAPYSTLIACWDFYIL